MKRDFTIVYIPFLQKRYLTKYLCIYIDGQIYRCIIVKSRFAIFQCIAYISSVKKIDMLWCKCKHIDYLGHPKKCLLQQNTPIYTQLWWISMFLLKKSNCFTLIRSWCPVREYNGEPMFFHGPFNMRSYNSNSSSHSWLPKNTKRK